MIIHLKSNYYKITPAALKENTARMTSAYDVNLPFETIIDQIETAVDFADTRNVPFTPEQVEATAYDLILSTGYFTDSCRCWNLKSAGEKTWVNFKPFFAEEH